MGYIIIFNNETGRMTLETAGSVSDNQQSKC